MLTTLGELRRLIASELFLELKKIKSNDPMPPRTQAYIDDMLERIESWNSKHCDRSLRFVKKVGPEAFFEAIHSIRRWYSGQTMMETIRSHRNMLKQVMKLEPDDVVGIYRGFRIDRNDPLAKKKEGDEFSLSVTRNKKFSSWSTSKQLTNRFSGASDEKVGLIVQLIDTKNVEPVLAPPSMSEPWFNALYEELIGSSFRPTEKEYLIHGSPLNVKLLKLKE